MSYAQSKKTQDVKITKAEVVYVEPKRGEGHRFAQCATCRMWLQGRRLCTILGQGVAVDADDACAMYTPGGPAKESERVSTSFTPVEVGFVKDAQVRCENCRWGGPTCKRFGFPISSTGCCNGWRNK